MSLDSLRWKPTVTGRRGRIVKIMSAMAATSLLVSACGGDGTDVPPLAVAFGDASNGPGSAPWTNQISEGWDQEEGFDLQYQAVDGASTALQLLASGSVQLAQAGAPNAYAAYAQDDSLRIIGFWNGPFYQITTRQDSAIESAEDLEGSSIGVFAIGSGSQYMAEGAAASAGVDLETIEFLPLDIGAPSAEAFNSGRIDAMANWEGAWQSVSSITDAPLEPVESLLGERYGQLAMVTTVDAIENYRDELVGFMRNMYKSCAVGAQQPERLVGGHWDLYPEVGPPAAEREEALAEQASWFHDTYRACALPSPDTGQVGRLSDEELEATYDFFLDSGVIENPVDFASMVDFSITEEALSDVDLDAFASEVAGG